MIKFFRNLFKIDRVFAILTVSIFSSFGFSMFFLLASLITRKPIFIISCISLLFVQLILCIVITIWHDSEKENTVYIRGKRYEIKDMKTYKKAMKELDKEFPGVNGEQ